VHSQGAVGSALLTPSGRFLAVSESLCRMLGRSESSLLALELRDVIHPDDLASSLAPVEEVLAGSREGSQLENRYLHADGHLIWGQASVCALRQQAEPACLFLVQINDRHGHAAGDALLLAVSGRLVQVLRSTDLVGRIGGDELLVLLDGVDGLEEAIALAERLRRRAREPVEVDGRRFAVTLSIGVTLYRPGESVDALVARADAAMYDAKTSGRDRVIAIPAACG
jgi:diguanylate cyclase (GGDEF)-like protein